MKNQKFLFLLILIASLQSQVLQALEGGMIGQMAFMAATQMAGQIANQSISQEFSDAANALGNTQSTLGTLSSTFQKQAQTAQQALLSSSTTFFGQAATNVNTQMSAQNAEMSQAVSYIQQLISLQQPQTNALSQPVFMDQIFNLATMYTPQGTIWKNPFNLGNWEYDETTDSFWQMAYAAFQTSSGSKFNPQAACNNSIFTEWLTRASNYVIECEITLYSIVNPSPQASENNFCVGLLFNKNRWISGDIPGLQKYRLLSLYGSQTNGAKIYFNETLATPKTIKQGKHSKTKIQYSYPIDQIVAKTGMQKISITTSTLKNLKQKPLTFRLKILTTPTQIQYKFWQPPATEPATAITIPCKNSDLFLYHGIGFLCAGALAQFKLLQPTELLFSSTAIKNFQTEVSTYIQQALNQQAAANIDKAAKGTT